MATKFEIWVKNKADGTPDIFLKDPDAPPPPPPRPQARGANLVGGSSYWDRWLANGPIDGTHYRFIQPSEVDRLVATGMKAFRIVFTWEALQPTEYAVLATLSGNYKIYRDKLYALVDYVLSKGCTVLLDIHGDEDKGFAAYHGVTVGSSTSSGQKVEDMLANLWGQLATKYKTNPKVWYGVTNEPHGIAAPVWYGAAQKVIDAIRKTGSTSKIVMPGTDWSGAASWMKNNAQGWNLVDPAKNLAVQLHMYFSPDGSGATSDIKSETVGVESLMAVTAWARAKGLELILGEVGLSAANPLAAKTWSNTLAFINANRDVIGGFFWWAAGDPAWWGGYRFTLLDKAGAPSPQLKLLQATQSFAS